MTATISLHPQRVLGPGRYRLDHEGRLHPARYAFVKTVAMVTVSPKVLLDQPEPVLEEALISTAEPEPVLSPVSPRRVDRFRSVARKPALEPAHREAEADDTGDDEVFDEFRTRFAAIRARRASQEKTKTAAAKIDGARLAAAIRARPAPAAPAKRAPTRRALDNRECRSCGVPGSRGCDHFLPYKAEGGL